MSLYVYSARNERGDLVQGQIDAESDFNAATLLQERGLLVVKLTPLFAALGAAGAIRRHRRVRAEDTLFFIEQTGVLLESGIPVLRTIDIISHQTASQNLYEILLEIKADIKAGSTFKDTLMKQPRYFPPFWSYVIEAGEASGTLPQALAQLARHQRMSFRIKSKIVSAMIYPLLLLAAALTALLLFIFLVIPTFVKMFRSFKADLPVFTMSIIRISDFIRDYFLFLAAAAAGLVYLLRNFISTPEGRRLFDQMTLRLPVLGTAASAVIHARINIILATLIRSGLNLLKSLEIAANTAGNLMFRDALNNVALDVQKGKALHASLASNPIFGPMMVQLIMIGEESGKLAEMIEKSAEHYQGQVDTFITRVSAFIEPVILLGVGAIVGTVIVAMYLPLFSLATLTRG